MTCHNIYSGNNERRHIDNGLKFSTTLSEKPRTGQTGTSFNGFRTFAGDRHHRFGNHYRFHMKLTKCLYTQLVSHKIPRYYTTALTTSGWLSNHTITRPYTGQTGIQLTAAQHLQVDVSTTLSECQETCQTGTGFNTIRTITGDCHHWSASTIVSS